MRNGVAFVCGSWWSVCQGEAKNQAAIKRRRARTRLAHKERACKHEQINAQTFIRRIFRFASSILVLMASCSSSASLIVFESVARTSPSAAMRSTSEASAARVWRRDVRPVSSGATGLVSRRSEGRITADAGAADTDAAEIDGIRDALRESAGASIAGRSDRGSSKRTSPAFNGKSRTRARNCATHIYYGTERG